MQITSTDWIQLWKGEKEKRQAVAIQQSHNQSRNEWARLGISYLSQGEGGEIQWNVKK